MMRLVLQPEPEDFDDRIRQKGNKAIAKFKKGKIAALPPYWRECLDDLWTAYGGTCAYLCVRIFKATGARTVDHFSAKSSDLMKAYEWSNYRLVCSTINGWKKNYDDVLDPFEIEDDWFALEFKTDEPIVVPGAGLKAVQRKAVVATIDRLRLNDSKCVYDRRTYYDEYMCGETTFAFLRKYCPFVARELDRLGLRRTNDGKTTK